MREAAHLDFEWAAPVDLKKAGTFRLFEHPAARIWCASWRISRGPVNRWRLGYPDPVPLLDWIASGKLVVAHNAAGAEWVAWNLFLRKHWLPHWPELKIEQLSCTMARCLALGLPGRLEDAAKSLRLPEQKDADGGALAKKMAKPRKRQACWRCKGAGCVTCFGIGETYEWWDTPENIERLMQYCDQDVLTECALDEAVPELSDAEREIWIFDQQMNARGIHLDMPLVDKAHRVVELAKADLDAEMKLVTGGAVVKHTQTKELAKWIEGRGIPCKSVAKGVQEDLMLLAYSFDDPAVTRAIEIRRLGKSSTAKLDAMQDCVCKDGNARGLLQYHAAHTGREGGRLIQPQNLHRVDEEVDGENIDHGLTLLEQLPAHVAGRAISLICGEPTDIIAKAMRRMFKAREGHRFIGGDLNNIEGCTNAWLSNETWKIEAYQAFQRGEGPDLYRVAYARAFGGDPSTVAGRRRQVGKVIELAYGYQGSVGAFISMGAVYGVKPAMVVEVVRAAASDDEWHQTSLLYHKVPAPLRYSLAEPEWTAIKITVVKFRASHPCITQGWWDLQDAAIAAVGSPGEIFPVFGGRIQYVWARGFLFCRLPTNRLLAYPKARLVEKDDSVFELADGRTIPADDVAPDQVDAILKQPGVTYKEKRRTCVVYEDRYLMTDYLYGGKQCENVVSGIARDAMFHGCLEARRRGYQCVLTVHDEQLNEMPFGIGSAKELQAIMEMPVPGLEGLPLKAKCFEDVRYSK